MITIEDLKKCNVKFDNKFGITDYEVDKANDHRITIEWNQSLYDEPQVGDIVEGTYYGGKYNFKRGIITEVYDDGRCTVCVHPYTPFIVFDMTKVILSVSGGPFFGKPKSDFKIISGEELRLFCDWGRCGACAGGAFNFPATVKRWRVDFD